MNIQQEQTKALSHEYWRFVDRTTNGFGGNNEPTYFYGVFSTDGSLIIELTLLGDVVEEDDPRAHSDVRTCINLNSAVLSTCFSHGNFIHAYERAGDFRTSKRSGEGSYGS